MADITTPCLEIDETQRLDSSTTVTARSFYDGLGQLIETRKPGPSASGNDIVQFNLYDTSGRVNWASIPYFVPTYSGTGSAFATPDTTQPHTTTSYDGLGRVTRTTDALGHVTTTSYSIQSGTFGAHGGNTDEVTSVVDALGHKTDTGAYAYDGSGSRVWQQDTNPLSPVTPHPLDNTLI